MPNRVDWTQWNLSYTDDIFGPNYGAWSCIIAVTNTLKRWLPTYIAEMNRQLGATVLKVPKTYEYRPTFMTAPRDLTPVLLVDCPRTSSEPQRLNSGIHASWEVTVGLWLYGSKDWREVQALVYGYLAAIRQVLLQQGSLGGFAETTKWTAESYGEQDHTAGRTIGLGKLTVEVSVLMVTDPNAGPKSTSIPQITPYPALTDVTSAEITVNNTKP